MITIEEYLSQIYEDFYNYVSRCDNLCDLKSLHYQAGNLPDYSDINIQQLYLLRYAFAYAFEYKSMFLDLFKRKTYEEEIHVMSLGCGNAIDYWSLVQALKDIGEWQCKVHYRGIDAIDWNYKIAPRKRDYFWVEEENAALTLQEYDTLPFDVYFFPKSISEFSEQDFDIICNCFSRERIEKDEFHIMISLRLDSGSMNRDMRRSKMLVEAIKRNGYTTRDNPDVYTYFVEKEAGIRHLDSDFKYPDEALELLKSLKYQCEEYSMDEIMCKDDCEKYLNRQPALKVRNIRFQILSFSRKE